MKRRALIAGLGAFIIGGCSKIASSAPGASLLSAVEDWNKGLHNLLGRRTALAREFQADAISPTFRGNGTVEPDGDAYRQHRENGFRDWQLAVTGLVAQPLSLSLTAIKAMPQRTQITRHDCVEGWSAIGQWTGVPLHHILDQAKLLPDARFIVFRCADRIGGAQYYESIDLIDAFHPQTLVAHSLNGEPLPIKNGAPLRMRIERQLGYKHAKYLTKIEVVASLDEIEGGKGGYWEDQAKYQWYAGI